MAASAVTKNSGNIKQTISHELPTDFAKICVILVISLSSKCECIKQVRHSFPRNSCFSRLVGCLFLVKRPLETVFQSILSRLQMEGERIKKR